MNGRVLTCSFLIVALAALALPVAAQGMSEEYVRQRTDEKLSRPHGFSIEWDLFAHIAYFEQQQKIRGNGLPGDAISFRDAGGTPFGVFPSTELRMRFSWHDSLKLGWNAQFLRAFNDEFDDTTRFNGVIYPEGTDQDYGADFMEFNLIYRRDIFRLGLSKNFTMYVQAGLEYAYIKAMTGSDNFPVEEDRDEETFRELLPWYTVGLGTEIEIGSSIRLRVDARGTYMVGFPTFQKRDGDSMKQSVVGLNAHFAFEYNLTEWFALIARVNMRYLRVKLYGGDRADSFLWYSLGPELGIGFRF